ncbi:efflux transporter, RND family, MFP subunit [Denitrovibrio acetiphilus DSM 12809]|jgi:RND family efflux transporter MFP subunit|uniref:Efflux transporter, RND family, MFP subunit n=1 Tax=Denitrovibrio acetiphilus (strain DSM 12809 / NBRC 114555 / N2460) TaxID=522772 RepID=D4H898_DENA2|nr:efflux RND transporter periplasmic adaptor subunit [Denitrovibrio acetiphilus]ADD68247.1 efflux transporter, RND family, MFP subunit [Denitrovibrio acetiphilus DSM 12809]
MNSNLISKFTILFVIVVFGTYGCGDEQAYEKAIPQKWETSLTQASVGAPINYITTGSVISDQRIEVTSKLSGYIKRVFVQEGDSVQEGQVLVLLDSDEVDSKIRQANAAVATAAAAYQDAEIDIDRYEKLFKRGSISDNEIRKMQLRFETATESLKQAKAGLTAALSMKNYTELKSPVNGVIISKSKQAGDLAVPGVPILTLEVKEGFIIETFVAESRIINIHPDDTVLVEIDGIQKKLNGRVKSVVNVADPVTRSCQVKVSLPDVNGLRLGMFGRVYFNIGTSDTLIIPTESVVERGGLQGIFILDKEGVIRFRWLRTGRRWADKVEIDSGLYPDELFVLNANSRMRDGDLIIKEAVR